MTQILRLKETDRVLEVGTGSGYQAAIAARLAAEVYSVEILESLADRSRRTLSTSGSSTWSSGRGTVITGGRRRRRSTPSS